MPRNSTVPPAPPAQQDFTQAELLLGLRVVADPNGLFFCGDTCQTIARGIGFRRGDGHGSRMVAVQSYMQGRSLLACLLLSPPLLLLQHRSPRFTTHLPPFSGSPT